MVIKQILEKGLLAGPYLFHGVQKILLQKPNTLGSPLMHCLLLEWRGPRHRTRVPRGPEPRRPEGSAVPGAHSCRCLPLLQRSTPSLGPAGWDHEGLPEHWPPPGTHLQRAPRDARLGKSSRPPPSPSGAPGNELCRITSEFSTTPGPTSPGLPGDNARSLLPPTGCSSTGDWFKMECSEPGKVEREKEGSHSSATILTSPKKDMDFPILFQVPDVISKARRNQNEPLWFKNKQLCPACREMKTIQPKNLVIPDDHRVMSLHQPIVQKSKPPHNDIPTESIHYRLPILGPRTAVFHGLLSGAYKTLQETQHSSLSRKEQISKTLKH